MAVGYEFRAQSPHLSEFPLFADSSQSAPFAQ
jgi:hypothetical protein